MYAGAASVPLSPPIPLAAGCDDVRVVDIYIRLLDEGVDVWRPAQAVSEGAGIFRIVGPAPQPEDEEWEFPLGALVRGMRRSFADGADALVAESRIEP